MNNRNSAYWILPLSWLILVFYLSLQSGDDSSKISLYISEKLASNIPPETMHAFVRSSAHFCIHFVLAILCYCAAYYNTEQPAKFTAITCIIIAIVDEVIQLIAPGRFLELADIMLNVSGTIIALAVCTFIAPKPQSPHI